MLKLNSLSTKIFEKDMSKTDSNLKVNGHNLSRENIIAAGRLVACEYAGARLSERGTGKYNSRLPAGVAYSAFAEKHRDQKIMFCAKLHYNSIGKDCPDTMDEIKSDAISLAKSPVFLNALAAIDTEIIKPIIATIYDDVGAGGFMTMMPINMGETGIIEVQSNDIFLFQDGSWGSANSAPNNYLYSKTITLNPQVFFAKAKMKWYQNLVNGDAGQYYAALMNGMWNKMYAILMNKVVSAANNTALIPSGLTAASYTTANWNTICTKVAAANGVKRTDLVAFGMINALANVLPTDSTPAAITGLQYGLGEEWFKRGFLPNASGVQLIEVDPAIVPGTQNTTIDTIGLGDNIYIAAKGGTGYAPFVCGFFKNSPITINYTATETADFTIDVNVQAMFDIQPLFASKVGVIKNAGANE